MYIVYYCIVLCGSRLYSLLTSSSIQECSDILFRRQKFWVKKHQHHHHQHTTTTTTNTQPPPPPSPLPPPHATHHHHHTMNGECYFIDCCGGWFFNFIFCPCWIDFIRGIYIKTIYVSLDRPVNKTSIQFPLSCFSAAKTLRRNWYTLSAAAQWKTNKRQTKKRKNHKRAKQKTFCLPHRFKSEGKALAAVCSAEVVAECEIQICKCRCSTWCHSCSRRHPVSGASVSAHTL